MKTTIALLAVCLFAALFFAGVAAQAFAEPTAGGLVCAVVAGGLFLIAILVGVALAVDAWFEGRKPDTSH